MFGKIFNLSSIARHCKIDKHKIMLFNNGVVKSLNSDQIDDAISLVEKESEKTIKSLRKIKKENENSQ